MMLLAATHDRAKASEHAIVFVRGVPSSINHVSARLPFRLRFLAHEQSLQLPAGASSSPVPITMSFNCLHDQSRWLLRLRYNSGASRVDFFDGEFRLDDIAKSETKLTLIGRYAVPEEMRNARFGQDAFRNIAEQNLSSLFDAVLRGL